MKKIFALLLSCMMIISIAACGNSKYIGTWEVEKAEMAGEEASGEMLGGMSFEFKKGGKAEVTAMGENNEIEWEVKDGKLKMTNDGETIETPVEVDGDTMIMEDFNGAKMTLKKK